MPARWPDAWSSPPPKLLSFSSPSTIPEEIAGLLRRAALQAWPEEACGLLVGPTGGRPNRFVPCPNRAVNPRRSFQIDPLDFLAAVRLAESQGEAVLGLFHSHPSGQLTLSTEDRAQAAAWRGLDWVVVALQRGPEGPRCVGLRTYSAEEF